MAFNTRFLLLVLGTFTTLCYCDHGIPDLEHVMAPSDENCIKNLKQKQAENYGIHIDGVAKKLLTPYFAGDVIMPEGLCQRITNEEKHRTKRHIVNFNKQPELKWPNFPIKYKFNGAHTQEEMGVIRSALHHIEAQTCSRFQEVPLSATVTESHVEFGSGSRCVSFIGRSTSSIPQPIYLGASCFDSIGTVARQIVRVLGQWPEHVRPDKDEHIIIHGDNVQDSQNRGNLENSIPAAFIETFGLEYDFASVTHHHSKIYSSNGEHTIKTKDPLRMNTIGQGVGLSFLDAKAINFAYCNNTCNGQPLSKNCENSSYQDPNDCSKCKCPDGFGGSYCEQLEPSVGTICGGVVTVTDKAEITSPGYDSSDPAYNVGQQCTWKIKAAYGGNIKATFVDDFGIYCNFYSSCFHWVEIRHKKPLYNTGYRFCCKTRPTAVLTSDSDEMMVNFRSNWSDATRADRRGFKLLLEQVNFAPCKSSPCQNGGICLPDATSNNVDGYMCMCAGGFAGRLCNQSVDECQSAPCQNGGTCIDGTNRFTCTCTSNYQGPLCDQVIKVPACNSSPCKNGATCTDQADSYICTCATGYTGEQCDQVIQVPACNSNPCKNGATCTDQSNGYICKCLTGYTGVQCDQAAGPCDPSPCKNGGTCTRWPYGAHCFCAQGYIGRFCEQVSPCASNPCQNGGQCRNTVYSYYCLCSVQYTGNHCQTKRVNPCNSSPCLNGGTCLGSDYSSHYTCLCRTDYEGNTCQRKKVNPCDSNPCLNGGTCSRLWHDQSQYTCSCMQEYKGSRCKKEKSTDCDSA